jgi:hypothetical protein
MANGIDAFITILTLIYEVCCVIDGHRHEKFNSIFLICLLKKKKKAIEIRIRILLKSA